MDKKETSVFLLEDTGYDQKGNRIKGWELGITVLLMTGFLDCFYLLYSQIPFFWILFVAGIGAVSLLGIFKERKTVKLWIHTGIFAMCVVVALINGGGVLRGLLYCINQCFTAWNAQFDDYITLFALNSISEMDRLSFAVVIVLLGSVLLAWLVQKKAVFLLTVISYGILFFTLLLGICQEMIGVVLVTTGWLLLWLRDILIHQSRKKNIASVMAVVLFVGIMAFVTRNYEGTAMVEAWKHAILDTVDEFRYGKDTLPQGELKKAYEMTGGEDDEKLVITFEEAQEMYLRGYVGSEYTGTGWETLNEGVYKTEESAGLMEWLRAQGFSVSAQYIEYETARAGTAPGLSEFEVDNVGAYRKYAYTPYEVAGVSKRSIQEIYDWQYQSDSFFGTDNYTYTSAASEIPNELMVAQSMEGDTAKAYTEAENIYRAFVHDHYLTIEDDQADEMKELFFSNENVQEENVYQVTTQIRIALQQMARYSEKPYEYPENQEFVDWFLNRAKVGNAAYFATAATMAFRAAGIPARYVEGYFLTESKANELKAADASSVTLTAHDTHAWTEIYIDGIGWMPVEVVPGFYFAEYTTQQVLDMPQSAVAVTDQEEQEELQGSTTDKLEALTDENNPEEETPIEKTVRILGILVGIAVFLELCFLIIQLQHSVRKGSYKRKLNKADTDEKAAILYDTVSLIFMIDKIPGSSEFPYERTTDVSQHYESVDPKDYERFLSLVQKSRFSTEELKTNEIHAITAFTEKITQESYKNARGWKKLLMKYWYIVYDC